MFKVNIVNFIGTLIYVLYSILVILLTARVILSWFPHKSTFVSEFLNDVTDPILKPVQKIIPPISGIDFSPIIAFFLLRGLYSLVMIIFISITSGL